MNKLFWSIRRILAISISVMLCVGVVPSNVYASDEFVAEEIQIEEPQPEEFKSEESQSETIQPQESQPEEIQEEVAPVEENQPNQPESALDEEPEFSEIEQSVPKATESDKESSTEWDEGCDKGAVPKDKGDGAGEGSDDSATSSTYTLSGSVTSNRAGGSSDNPSNGSENRYTFTFDAVEKQSEEDAGTTHSYSAYVYGNGVNPGVCTELANAYLKGLATAKGPGNSVINTSFTDADKLSDTDYFEGYDSDLCWAYSASNALWQTQWITKANLGIFGAASEYFKSEDDVADYAAYCFKDHGGDEKNIWNWMFTGYFDSPNNMRFGQDDNDAILSAYDSRDMYEKIAISEGTTAEQLASALGRINGNSAATLGIYYFGNGGHAMSLTGYIMEDGVPVAVIVTDPDNSVKNPDQGLVQEEIDNVYTVYPISQGNVNFTNGERKNLWYFMPDDAYDARIGDISILRDSSGIEPSSGYVSPYPTGTRAIKDSLDASIEYTIGNDASLAVPLDAEFLSYYDINYLEYAFIDENNSEAFTGRIESNKETWNNLKTAENISLIFGDAVDSLNNGRYKLQVYIDYLSFRGNYGWFALKKQYSDTLVNVWVNLLKTITESSGTNDPSHNGSNGSLSEGTNDLPINLPINEGKQDYNSFNDESGKGKVESYTNYDVMVGAILKEYGDLVQGFVKELVNEIDITKKDIESYKDDTLKVEIIDGKRAENTNNVTIKSVDSNVVESNVQYVMNDLIRAVVADPAAVTYFKNVGVDIDKVDIKNLNLILSTSIKLNKAGTVRFSGKNIKYKTGDKVFAMIKFNDGTTKYVKAKIEKDGSISFKLPQEVKEITIFSI